MKAFRVCYLLLPVMLLAASCNNDSGRSRNTEAAESMADSVGATSDNAFATATAEDKPVSLADHSRKIIKTADLRCRVADVYGATIRMERLAAFTGGQISQSSLENQTDATRALPYTADSLRQVQSYTTTAHLTLRIPVSMLDTVLSDIAVNASFINSRNLHLNDVTLRYLSNKLKNEAMGFDDAAQHAQSLARKSAEATAAGDYADTRNDTRIDRRIENMQLSDQVTYATLNVDLYQPQRISQTILPNIDYLMKPSFLQQTGMALNTGWQLLRAIFIVLLQVWPLLILAFAGMGIYRHHRGKQRSRKLVVRV